MKKKGVLSLWAVYESPYVMTCHFEADENLSHPDRHIFLRFLQGKNVGHSCGTSPMASLSWIVVIDHIIFLMRGVSFCYICIKVRY